MPLFFGSFGLLVTEPPPLLLGLLRPLPPLGALPPLMPLPLMVLEWGCRGAYHFLTWVSLDWLLDRAFSESVGLQVVPVAPLACGALLTRLVSLLTRS